MIRAHPLSLRLGSRLLLSISLLAGCAAPQPPGPVATGLQLPQDWTDATAPRAGASALAAWWERFHDPLLASLIEEALQANTSVESGRQAWAQARALSEVAAAGLRPSVQAPASTRAGKPTCFNACMPPLPPPAWTPRPARPTWAPCR